MNEINIRLIQIAKYYGITKHADFARRTGFSHQVASNYLKGERIPNAEALCAIKRTFDISADWLLTGEGDMLRHEPPALAPVQASEPTIIYKSDPKDLKMIEDKAKIIALQEEKIKMLEEKLHDRSVGLHSALSVDTTPGIGTQHTRK